MREFFREIAHALEAGEGVELVTILVSGGSTPRGAGAMMAVFADGHAAGTIGGGSVEFEAQKTAAELLASGGECRKSFRFVQGEAASLGMVCGGDVTLQFQYLSGGDRAAIAVMRDLVDSDGRSADTWLVLRFQGEHVTAVGTADRSGTRHLDTPPADLESLLQNRAVLREDWFAAPAVRAGRTYVFGGGHVSRALVPVFAAAEFRPVVYDDRPEFVTPQAFPQAEGLLCGPFTELARHVTVTPEDYVVIMTRGHQADYEVLSQVLRSGAKYLGCIGSRRKLALCKERLLAAGFTEAEYARLHAPIGLAIGAQTPSEIAVSVAAELIAVRAGVQP